MSEIKKPLMIMLSTWLAVTIYVETFAQSNRVEPTCEERRIQLKDYIFNSLNFCTSDSDCVIAFGICPLGSYFIMNRQNLSLMDSINTLILESCGGCTYDKYILPRDLKLVCRNNKGCPSVEFIKEAIFFSFKCEQIVYTYSQDIIGNNINKFNLPDYIFRVIHESDTSSMISLDPYHLDRVKVVIDDIGIVKSLGCDDP
jgi:hypothetical protein